MMDNNVMISCMTTQSGTYCCFTNVRPYVCNDFLISMKTIKLYRGLDIKRFFNVTEVCVYVILWSSG